MSTPIELMPTLSLCGEFEKTMDNMTYTNNAMSLVDMGRHARDLYAEMKARGVTLDTSQAHD